MFDKLLLSIMSIVLVVFLLIIVLAIYGAPAFDKRELSCQQQGGELVKANRSGYVCVKVIRE